MFFSQIMIVKILCAICLIVDVVIIVVVVVVISDTKLTTGEQQISDYYLRF